MELLTGLFIFGLFKATEKIWEKGFDAAWDPVDKVLKARFARWAGQGRASQRQAAFHTAAEVARANTVRYAADPHQAITILDALDNQHDPEAVEALAQEAAKLMLFSASPEVPRLVKLCRQRLRWDAIWGEAQPPPPDAVAAVVSDFLVNLREALLDQEAYHGLIQREMLRTLREIAAPPVAYDDEAAYRYQLAQTHRQIDFVGIPDLKQRRPINLDDIFIHLQAERHIQEPKVISEQNHIAPSFERDPSTGQIHFAAATERVEVDDALRATKRLVLLGDPGAGKTTFLKHLTVICAESRAEPELEITADDGRSPLPIFIPLREFAAECATRQHDYCLLDYFYTHAREHLLLNLAPGFFEDALQSGRCIVCLDGLDEVWATAQRKTVTHALNALAARFPHNRYLVTSRIVGYESAPLDRGEFAHHTILPLDDTHIRDFVRKWYAVREQDPVQRKQKADDLLDTIQREPRIKSLAKNPLLLTIIALVHRIEAQLPHERVKLYDKCVTALVDTWEEVKGLSIADKQRPFYRYRRRLLERLAYELHAAAEEPEHLQMVKAGDLQLLLAGFLMHNPRLHMADDPDAAQDEARAFIRLARGRTGLLIERGYGVFAFPHLTFQEYLAACDIESRCIHRGVGAIWEQIKDRLHDPHWREVILLLLGSLNKYDEPPTLLVQHILQAGDTDTSEPLLHRHLYLAAHALADKVDLADDLHRRIIASLLDISRQAQGDERKDALEALSSFEGDPYAADGLLTLARDPGDDHRLRRYAAAALARLGCIDTAIEILSALNHDPHVTIGLRLEAAWGLGRLGQAADALAILLTHASDSSLDPDICLVATRILSELRTPGDWVEIVFHLSDAHTVCLETYIYPSPIAPVTTAKFAAEGFLPLARDPRVASRVRLGAARALLKSDHAEEAMDILLSLAREPQVGSGVRANAARQLLESDHAHEATDILLSLARDPQVESWVRAHASRPLLESDHAQEATDILLSVACDPQVGSWVRAHASRPLLKSDHAQEATDILLSLARDPQVESRVRADFARPLLESDHAQEATGILLSLARDPQVESRVRANAARQLLKSDHAQEATDILLSLARDPQVESRVRANAARPLLESDHAQEATDILLSLARDPQVASHARLDAARALATSDRADDAIEILLALALECEPGSPERTTAYSELKRLMRQ